MNRNTEFSPETTTRLYSEGYAEFDIDSGCFPFRGEFLLTAEKAGSMSICVGDFRHNKAVLAAYSLGRMFPASEAAML